MFVVFKIANFDFDLQLIVMFCPASAVQQSHLAFIINFLRDLISVQHFGDPFLVLKTIAHNNFNNFLICEYKIIHQMQSIFEFENVLFGRLFAF